MPLNSLSLLQCGGLIQRCPLVHPLWLLLVLDQIARRHRLLEIPQFVLQCYLDLLDLLLHQLLVRSLLDLLHRLLLKRLCQLIVLYVPIIVDDGHSLQLLSQCLRQFDPSLLNYPHCLLMPLNSLSLLQCGGLIQRCPLVHPLWLLLVLDQIARRHRLLEIPQFVLQCYLDLLDLLLHQLLVRSLLDLLHRLLLKRLCQLIVLYVPIIVDDFLHLSLGLL